VRTGSIENTNSQGHRSILIVQTAFLGDLLLGIPLYRRIRKNRPDRHLILLCRKGLGDFFLKTKLVDQVIEVQKNNSESYRLAKEKLLELQNLSEAGFEFIFTPHESLRTAFFVSPLKAEHKVTFRKKWNWFFFNQRISKNKEWPESLRQMSLLFPWDQELRGLAEQFESLKNFYSKDENGRLASVPDWCSMSLRSILMQDDFTFSRLETQWNLHKYSDRKWIFIFPGSVWATKMWSEEGFVEVGQKFQKEGDQVFVMGGPGEEALGDRVSSQIPGSINLVGQTTIYESALLLTRGALAIGNDSASAHLASCAAVPNVSVFGPTVLKFGYRPWSSLSAVVEKDGLQCRPCGSHGHRKCPLGTHECMKNISASKVQKSCEQFIPSNF